MGRSKRTPFAAWETAKTDGIEERYIRLGNSQMSTGILRRLNGTAFKLYCYMKLESGGKRDFEFPRAKVKQILSNDGFYYALDELIEAGLIEIVENNANIRKPNIYRFSDKWRTLEK